VSAVHRAPGPRPPTLAALALALPLMALAACTGPAAPVAVDDPSVGHLADLPTELIERLLPLVEGVGRVDRPHSTPSPEAGRLHDQGLAYLAGFAWLSAARSFHTALDLDPDLAVAHVGLARAYVGLESVADARRELEAAVAAAERRPPSPAEHRWIELARLQVDAVAAHGDDGRRLFERYREALDAALAETPDDPDLLVLRGNAEGPAPEAWGQAGGESAIGFYRRAQVAAPNYPPAHHFSTHAYENLGRHRQALVHARAYARLAPAIPHAHHMVAHVAPRLGGWEESLAELLTADRLHREAFAAEGLEPHQDWHFGHNLRLLASVELHLGHREAAERHLAETFALDHQGRRAGFYCLPRIEYLLAGERFEEARQAASDCRRRDSLFARVVGASTGGEAALALGNRAAAEAALARARAAQAELLATPRPLLGERVFQVTGVRALGFLAGKLALAGGDGEGDGGRALAAIARGLAGSPNIDGWVATDLRLADLAATARRHGAGELADELESLRRAATESGGERIATGSFAGCGG
jgi:tetratricopeptide (TPR) repeat protein